MELWVQLLTILFSVCRWDSESCPSSRSISIPPVGMSVSGVADGYE